MLINSRLAVSLAGVSARGIEFIMPGGGGGVWRRVEAKERE